MNSFTVGNSIVGGDAPIYFIADIAANHDGSLDRAKRLIEMAANSGASAVKFQHFRAKYIVSRRGFEDLRGKLSHQSAWSKSVYDVYEDASLPWTWTDQLAITAQNCGVDFFTAPYDLEAIDFVDPYVPAFKVGSGDITWIEAIEHMARKGKPIFIATGASSMSDVERAVTAIRKHNVAYCLMQCNTNYTGNDENKSKTNINVLKTFSQKFSDSVLGLSDHTTDNVTVMAGIALGAKAIEKHFTDDTSGKGPDHHFSLDATSWRKMVDEAKLLQEVLGDGEKKIEENELETVIIQRRALRYKRNLKKGHVLTKEDIFPLRPYSPNGVPPYLLSAVVGKTLNSDVSEDELLTPNDVN